MRTALAAALGLLVLLPIARSAAAQEAAAPPVEAATQPVERLYAALQKVAAQGQALGLEGRREALAPVVDSAYYLDFMAEKVLGRHWRELSEAQQSRWKDLFRRLTVSSYAERFDEDEGLRFEVLGAEPSSRGTAVVRSRLHPPEGDVVQLDYRLVPGPEGWRIVDVYLNGTVSELALRRSEYDSVIERDGFDALADSIDTRIREGRAAGDLPGGED